MTRKSQVIEVDINKRDPRSVVNEMAEMGIEVDSWHCLITEKVGYYATRSLIPINLPPYMRLSKSVTVRPPQEDRIYRSTIYLQEPGVFRAEMEYRSGVAVKGWGMTPKQAEWCAMSFRIPADQRTLWDPIVRPVNKPLIVGDALKHIIATFARGRGRP